MRKGLPHFTGASFNGRTAFLYSAYIRSIRIAPTIGSVQAALPELFSPFWQSGKTLDSPERRAHGEHSLGAGPQEPRAGRCNSVRPTRRQRDKPCGTSPARIAAARNARKPVHTTKKHATAGRDRWQPGKTGMEPVPSGEGDAGIRANGESVECPEKRVCRATRPVRDV